MSAQYAISRADTDSMNEFSDEAEFDRVRSLLDEAGVEYETEVGDNRDDRDDREVRDVGDESDDGQYAPGDLPVDIIEHRDGEGGESASRSDGERSGPSPISTGLSPARFVAYCPVCGGVSGQVYRCEHCETDLTETGTTTDIRGGA